MLRGTAVTFIPFDIFQQGFFSFPSSASVIIYNHFAVILSTITGAFFPLANCEGCVVDLQHLLFCVFEDVGILALWM